MLVAGSTLGPYKILALLGSGGMGEVYRAHDTRLGRDVAIKVLSPHLAATPEVRARFEREARTISQLNHPHICTLHDIGHQDGTDYLVMELLEGETLAHRLEKGALPVTELLALGTQIAEALDRAHRAGVVHRDLKPGNVMLTKSGAKLMDFGLARAHGLAAAAPGALTESPTVSRPLTKEGTIVGTFQYMAPEQLEGKEADARSDLWALGCVLYEMATGKRAFEGESQASLIAAIMQLEPRPIAELQPLMPPALEHAVKRCLTKDPGDRWQSARDVIHELRWIGSAGSQAGMSVGHPPGHEAEQGRGRALRGREMFAWALAVLAVAATIVSVLWLRHSPRPAFARLTLDAPEGGILALGPNAAVSPDGRRVVFVVADSAGAQRLWIRPLDSSSVQLLAGTEGAWHPFWSPDSRFIAFFADGKLRKISAAGGAPETICDAPNPRGGTWSRDGVIVLAPDYGGPLMRVPSDGGDVVAVAKPDSTRGETALRFPCFLPDGRHFLYVSLPGRQGLFDVYVGSLDSPRTQRIMAVGSAPVYAEPGYLLFERNGRLVAQRFDRSGLRPKGRVMPVEDAPFHWETEAQPVLCPPAKDLLVLVTAKLQNTRLTWLDRAGRQTGTIPLPPGRYVLPTLSPDGRRAAVVKYSTATSADLWVVDLERSVASPLTIDGQVSMEFGCPWSPDGRRIAFGYKPSGPFDIYQVPASGGARPAPLVRNSALFKWPRAWTPDGKHLLYVQIEKAPGTDLWLLPLEGERKSVLYSRSSFNEDASNLSPDGRWLACASDESGRYEVYVRSFPVAGERYRVSTSGGVVAQWSRDGREMVFWGEPNYIAPSAVYSVDVQTTPTFKAGVPRLLFRQRYGNEGIAATGDLKRFLAALPAEGAAPPRITVVMNWQEALKR